MDKILKSAVKRELVRIVPSKCMEDYLNGRKEFTDREKATLIWNAPNTTLSNRLASLEVLKNCTSDEILKEKIRDRILYNQNALRATETYAKVCGSYKCMGAYDVENLFDGDWDYKEE